ncbi:MAG: hypothetical protein ACI93T_003276 [Porticoccaceae bacterium]
MGGQSRSGYFTVPDETLSLAWGLSNSWSRNRVSNLDYLAK